jgi:hypothetical protein
MKKIVTLITAVVSMGWFSASAQITLTSADLAYIGKQVQEATDTTFTAATMMPGAAGTNLTWNFSTLGQDVADTLTFTNPNWTPNGADFPGSTVAVEQDGIHIYFQNGSGARILGFAGDLIGTGDVISLVNTPGEIVANWPTTYNSNWVNNFRGFTQFYYGQDPGIGFTVDSIRVKRYVMEADTFDAWGSVTTPLGTFNSIRVKEYQHIIDSVDFYIQMFGGWAPFIQQMDSTMMYSWWANGVGFPLITMDMDIPNDTVSSVRWLKATPSSTGLNEVAGLQVSTYPNPATDAVTFEMDNSSAAIITLYSMQGQKLEAAEVKSNKTIVSTAKWPTGVYFYSVSDKAGKELQRGNFNVVR